MYGEVFGTSVQFVVLRVGRSLQSSNDLQSQYRGEIRVFSVGLLSATPTRVSENVDVRRPESQALIFPVSAFALEVVEFCTGFVADGIEYLI